MDVNGFIADLMDVNECQRTIYGILMVLNGIMGFHEYICRWDA